MSATTGEHPKSAGTGTLFALSLVAFLLSPSRGWPQAGNLDPDFGDGGKVVTNHSSAYAYDVAIQDDGRIVVVGTLNGDMAVARFCSDGSPDSEFSGGGFTTLDTGGVSQALSVAIQPDGNIVVGGVSGGDSVLARFTSLGVADPSFGDGSGYVVSIFHYEEKDFINSVALLPNGKILTAGRAAGDFCLARYHGNGSLDITFGDEGKGWILTDVIQGSTDEAYDLAIQDDGAIVLVGRAGASFALARYGPDGILDNSFGENGNGRVIGYFGGSSNAATSVVLQPDGKIVVAGRSGPYDDYFEYALARYDKDGVLDETFGTGGFVTSNVYGFSVDSNKQAPDIALQADSKIVLVGNYNGIEFVLGRYDPDGKLDESFDADGWVTTDFDDRQDLAQAVALQKDGKIVAAGSSSSAFALARYESLCEPQEEILGMIDQINDLIEAGSLNRGQGSSLIVKLDGAILSLDQGEYDEAIGRLGAFINAVEAAINTGRLSPEEGQPLIDTAQVLINYIEG